MLGTIINTFTIIAGSTLGACLRKGIGEKYRRTMFDALGLCCIVLGINASVPNMAKSEMPVLFILSLVIGGVIGTKLDLQGRIDRLTASSNSPEGGEDSLSFRRGLGRGCRDRRSRDRLSALLHRHVLHCRSSTVVPVAERRVEFR